MTPREIAESIAYLDLYTVELADKIEAAIEAALSEREREIARLTRIERAARFLMSVLERMLRVPTK